MLGACAGIDRNDGELLRAWYDSWSVISATAVRWSCGGRQRSLRIASDFHTATGSLDMSGNPIGSAILSQRGYVSESREACLMLLRPGSEPEMARAALRGLLCPVYTPYLGRRSFPLSDRLLGPVDENGMVVAGGRGRIVWDADDLDPVQGIDWLLDDLARPGTMESQVQIHEVELQGDMGVLDAWMTYRSRTFPHLPAPSLINTQLADLRRSSSRLYSLRQVDNCTAVLDDSCAALAWNTQHAHDEPGWFSNADTNQN